jgi:hypothetical protein
VNTEHIHKRRGEVLLKKAQGRTAPNGPTKHGVCVRRIQSRGDKSAFDLALEDTMITVHLRKVMDERRQRIRQRGEYRSGDLEKPTLFSTSPRHCLPMHTCRDVQTGCQNGS